jgi:hypothetical protein
MTNIKRLAVACLVLLLSLFGVPASADMLLTGAGVPLNSASSYTSYTGIGDLSVLGTPYAYWGGDCYTKNGTFNIFKVEDTATSTTSTVECSNGAYAVASGESLSTIETNCGGSNTTACLTIYMYDQTQSNRCTAAACDVQQTTTAGQPYLIYSNGTNCGGINAGLFCFSYSNGSRNYMQGLNQVAATVQPINLACVGRYAGGNAYIWDMLTVNLALAVNTDFYSYAGTWISNGGGVSTSKWSGFFASFDSTTASATQLNNGAATTTSQGTNTLGNGDYFQLGSSGNVWTGFLGACFVSSGTVFDSSGISSIYANWKSRWGGGML